MIDVYFTTTSKRKNSTLQPDFTSITPISCSLKAPTSEESPSFLLSWSGGAFSYNYCKWGDHYYWVDGVTFERNNLLTVSCSLDVLATYKSYILASTQFVAYSSVSGGAWLPDRRIAVMSNSIITRSHTDLSGFQTSGNLILSVLGKNGCVNYRVSQDALIGMLSRVQANQQSVINTIMSGFVDSSGSPDPSDIGGSIKSLADVMLQKDLLGNAYENAVSCIRSCIWVPFSLVEMLDDPEIIYLGNYNTMVSGYPITNPPTKSYNTTISIPWHFSDWRRDYCEEIYLYLPMVGTINIPTRQLTGITELGIQMSFCVTDGNISYMVTAGDNIIGTYGGSCAAQYPIGINQTASAGQIFNTALAGAEKVAGSLTAGTFPSASAFANLAITTYQVGNAAFSTNPTIIGGIGGGAGSKLPLTAYCVSVAHDTVVDPADMAATMGIPTQKPLLLSTCSGYCQCINAHIAAPAHGDVLNAIDEIVNSGFYIE